VTSSGAIQRGTRVPRSWWPAAALAAFVAVYSLRYVVLGESAYVPELAQSFNERRALVVIHTLFGPMALLSGLANLLPALRRPPRWMAHRIVGRVYAVSAVLLGFLLGSAGLALSLHATGGTLARVGFFSLALVTLGTVLIAYQRVRFGNVRAHREWVLRSYACIFGAVMLRIWLPLLIVANGGQFEPAYRVVAWLAWVPNLAFAELLIRRGWRPSFVPPPGLEHALDEA
jgi:hypothetical protein